MVLTMGTKVLVQVADPLAEQRNLDFRLSPYPWDGLEIALWCLTFDTRANGIRLSPRFSSLLYVLEKVSM